jgi:hypothetical protein
MKFSLKLLETDQQINQKILQALLTEITNFMNSGVAIIKAELPSILQNAIINTPEYISLLNGKLKYEFGIPDSNIKLANLIEAWLGNIRYPYMKPIIVGNNIKSSFAVNAVRVDFAEVLYTDDALVIDSIRGYNLPWLEWLLLEGNKVIIRQQEVVLGPNKFSRTGFALMRDSNKSWKVPSEFSGTANNNWITRAIDGVEDKIELLLEKAFQT